MKAAKALRVAATAALGLLMVAVLVLPAVGSNYVRYPSDDVCVRSDYPDTQGNPTGALLYVGGNFVSTTDYWATYMKFDLSQFVGGTVNKATLYMVCFAHSGTSVSVNAYEVTSDPYDWSENWMSWNAAASNLTVSANPAHTTQVNATNTVFTWDLTYEAQQHMGGDFSICLKEQNQPSSGRWAEFYSHDYTSSGYWPYLDVDYTAPDDEENDRWYSWEDLGTIIGCSGTCYLPITASNVGLPEPICGGMRSLELESNCPSGATQAYLAYVYGLEEGDIVYCSFWRYDMMPALSPSCQIWAHWNDTNPPDVNGDNGSAGGNPDFGLGQGWEMTDWSWVVSAGHTGLVIESRIESDPGGIVWIDDMHIRVPIYAGIMVPSCEPSAAAPATWGSIKAMYK